MAVTDFFLLLFKLLISWLQYIVPVAAWSGWSTVSLFSCFQNRGAECDYQSNKIRRDVLAFTWNSESCTYFTTLWFALRQVQSKWTFFAWNVTLLCQGVLCLCPNWIFTSNKLVNWCSRFLVSGYLQKRKTLSLLLLQQWMKLTEVSDIWNRILNLCM